MLPIEILMTDEGIGMKIRTDMRALSQTKFCSLGVQFLTSFWNAAEGLQQTIAQVILIDINKRVRGLLRQPRLVSRLMPRASWLIGAMFRSLRAFEELLAICGVGAATLEKGIGRIPIADY